MTVLLLLSSLFLLLKLSQACMTTSSSLYIFLELSEMINILLLRHSLLILLLFELRILFCTEKALSQGTEVRGMTRQMLAKVAKSGYWSL